MSEGMENGESSGLISQRDRELNFTRNDSRIFNTDRTSKVSIIMFVLIIAASENLSEAGKLFLLCLDVGVCSVLSSKPGVHVVYGNPEIAPWSI